MKVNPNQSKYNYMLENSMNHMNNIALTYGNKKISYEEMFESINRYAKLLYSKGVRKGDLIGICTLNTPEAVYLIYALNKIGAVAIGYNFFDNKERIKNDVELTGPKMIITTDYSYSSFKDLEKSLNISTIADCNPDKTCYGPILTWTVPWDRILLCGPDDPDD